MYKCMCLQRRHMVEPLSTHIANEVPVLCVCQLVTLQVRLLRERTRTYVAGVGLLTTVNNQMFVEVRFVVEPGKGT